ncbi:hypothetical protein D9611_004603 [Ephemerocybe angulata]|uniref:Uncharacterized protein n=1 Tax=Ephemerocybe angulata TaxID=980116 RepID=A0A8H5B2Y2_9AGAR|nr:hypothetical protein D9611_004603 [Tulosesus angulatus]
MMRNGFLLVRCVFFALLLLLTLLTMTFASWNINSSLKAGQTVATTSGLILFECCAFFIFTALAFLEVFRPKSNTARISVECSWVAGISLFQLGASISATINGSVFACRASSAADICASAWLLVPSMWLKSMITFAYFFSLLITVLAHREICDDIWKETIYTMAWFESGIDRVVAKARAARLDRDVEKGKSSSDWDVESAQEEDPYGGYFDDIESSSARKKQFATPETNTAPAAAPWANEVPIRRGKDTPFSVNSTPATMAKALPPAPKSNASSRFIERFRESRILSRFELPSLYGTHFMNNGSTPFQPPTSPNHDVDKPIPLPRLSQWVRADDHSRR